MDDAGYRQLCDDLAAEQADLDGVVFELDAAAWVTPTPAVPWSVADQIGHLAASEDLARLAAVDPAAFAVELERMVASVVADPDQHLSRARSLSPSELLHWWRTARSATLAALRDHGPDDRLPWVGPAMSAVSFATARLMETWAHGQDVVDGLGVSRAVTPRLRHVAELGVRTRGFSYANRGLPVPETEIFVELDGPDGQRWSWGPSDAVERVSGTALDFCLVVTQRRPPAATALRIVGPAATEWMSIAQAFAGPPTEFSSKLGE